MYFKSLIPFFATAALIAEIPESSLKKFPPMTEIYHPVSTTNSEAQKSFDRGLTYMFAYNHDIAFASFEKASQLDPNLAMAYWGMALALGQNVNEDVTPDNEIKCYNYVQQAIKLSDNASQNEKDYIKALSTRYVDDLNADLVPLRFHYRDAMKKLIALYPEDLDAITLYAESILNLDPWKWWTPEGKPVDGTMEAVEKLDFVLSRNPYHMGANHFIIHAWEESPTPQRALADAYRLQNILPESGHLLHMPCHIFLPCGDYESAVNTSKKAIAQDYAYFKEFGMTKGTYPTHYLSHNIYVLARTYMLMEDYDNAIKTAMELLGFVKPYFELMPHLAPYSNVPLEIYLYFHKWKEILAYQPPSNAPIAQSYWHYARAKAYASLGDLAASQKERESMLLYKKQITKNVEVAKNPGATIIDLAEMDLDATVAYVQKKIPEAIDAVDQAIRIQDRLNYDEPPAWYIPMRIVKGALLLEQKKYVEAENEFKVPLKGYIQRNGRALFGLAASLLGQNRTIDAYWIEREMNAALKHATRQLTLEDLK